MIPLTAAAAAADFSYYYYYFYCYSWQFLFSLLVDVVVQLSSFVVMTMIMMGQQ